MNSYRDYTWDVVRGIGILMVVLGHCAPRPLVDFVYLFHMGKSPLARMAVPI